MDLLIFEDIESHLDIDIKKNTEELYIEDSVGVKTLNIDDYPNLERLYIEKGGVILTGSKENKILKDIYVEDLTIPYNQNLTLSGLNRVSIRRFNGDFNKIKSIKLLKIWFNSEIEINKKFIEHFKNTSIIHGSVDILMESL